MRMKVYAAMIIIGLLLSSSIVLAVEEKSKGQKAGEAVAQFTVSAAGGILSGLWSGVKTAYDGVTNDPEVKEAKGKIEYIFSEEKRRSVNLQDSLKRTDELLAQAQKLLSDTNSEAAYAGKKTKHASPTARAKSDLDYIFGK